MTDRTKIERVGGHLVVTGCDFVNKITGQTYAASSVYPIESLRLDENESHVIVASVGERSFFNVSGWTASEILEVAYGADSREFMPGELEAHHRLNGLLEDAVAGELLAEAAADEIERQRETIRALNTVIDDLTRAGLETERENKVLREVLRRQRDFVRPASLRALIDLALGCSTSEGPAARLGAEQELASIHEAAGVER